MVCEALRAPMRGLVAAIIARRAADLECRMRDLNGALRAALAAAHSHRNRFATQTAVRTLASPASAEAEVKQETRTHRITVKYEPLD